MAIILIAMSIKTVDQNEVAISYCTIVRSLSPTLEQGLHFVCPDSRMFYYTRTFIDNYFASLECLSSDGLYMDLTLTTQYRLDIEDLSDILIEFGTQEELDAYIDVIIQDTVRETCSYFTATEFYVDRGGIETAMIANVTARVDSSNAHVTTGFFQLQNVGLPSELTVAINNKQAALEYVDVVANEREQTLIERDTELLQAVEQATIYEIETQAAADASVISAQASADARVVEGQAEADAIIAVGVQQAAAISATWEFDTDAIASNIVALGVSAEEYVDLYLMPRLNTDLLDPTTTACLASTPTEDAWWCWAQSIQASVAAV